MTTRLQGLGTISSVRGALTMAMLVQDIDLLLNRMAVRDAAEV